VNKYTPKEVFPSKTDTKKIERANALFAGIGGGASKDESSDSDSEKKKKKKDKKKSKESKEAA